MKTAVIFPGQGAQSVGMGRDLADAFPACRALFDRANEMLGYDLARICFEGPPEELTKSDRAQPAIFTVSMAALQALEAEEKNMEFAATAGLSSGEYAALHYAGVLTFDDALRVLEARSRYMQEACERTRGGMLSVIGLDAEKLELLCEETGIEVANLNSAAQTVLSGPVDGIEAAAAKAAEYGAKKAIPLQVAGAFHSSLMQSAADQLAEFLQNIPFSAPRMPVLSNVTAQPHEEDPDRIRRRMVEQITGSVRWLESVEWMQAQGVDRYIECGPGKVLTGLVKRIDKSAALDNISDLPSVQAFSV